MFELRPESPLVTGEFPSPRPSGDLHVSQAYTQAIRDAREWHTDPELELMEEADRDRVVREEEQRSAAVIQAGRREVENRPEVQEAIAEMGRQKGKGRKANAEERLVICLGALSPDDPARLALNKLVETHLEFAGFLARVSVGIVSEEEMILVSGTTKSGRPKKIGAFAQVSKLCSPGAELDDRIQVANLGLIEAAWDFGSSVASLPSFKTFAEWKIHSRLQLYVKGDGEEPLLSGVTASMKETVHRDIEQWQDLGWVRQQEIIRYNGLHTPTTLEAVSHLPVATSELTDAERTDLAWVLEKVFTGLLDREAGILRMRYGIGAEGGPKLLDEIATVYGVTRGRISFIEAKAMDKLRHPSRSLYLREFTGSDLTAAEVDQVEMAAERERTHQEIVIRESRARFRAQQANSAAGAPPPN